MNEIEKNYSSEYKIPYSWIKAEAERLGFSAFGTAPVRKVADAHIKYQKAWTEAGYAADMEYLKRNIEIRNDPRLLVDGAQTIISVALSYTPPQEDRRLNPEQWQIAWYARGEDYHRVMRRKLEELLHTLQEKQGSDLLEGRVFCDTAPLMERYWAWRCGLGWIGRNHQLIIPHQGSAFFLGEIIINQKVDYYDHPIENNFCGTCHRCIDACPTGALRSDKGLDARKCLSYLTIEYRGNLPETEAAKMYPCFYGCDRCQAVCPQMNQATPTKIPELQERPNLKAMTKDQWRTLDIKQYQDLFRHSAVKRVKYEGLVRNIKAMDVSSDQNQSDQKK